MPSNCAQWCFFLLLLACIPKKACSADTTKALQKMIQPSDSALAVDNTGPRAESMISKETAVQLADRYLKSKKLAWGKPVSVALVHQSGSIVIVVEGADHQTHEETWDSCYYVQYPTLKNEKELTGIKTVAVTRDGLKVAIPASE